MKLLWPKARFSNDVTQRPRTGATRLYRWFNHVSRALGSTIQLGTIGAALVASATSAFAQNTLVSPPGQQRTVTLACNSFPPSKIADRPDMPGYDVEVLRAAFASRNITLLTPFYPWNRAYFLAQIGVVDGLCSCSYLPEREADFQYSDLLGQVRVAFYAANPEVLEGVNSVEDVTDMTVGVVNGYSLEAQARAADLDVIIANNEKTLLNLMLIKRLDAVLSFKAPVDYLFSTDQDDRPDATLFTEKIISEAPYYSCISQRAAEKDVLLRELNTGLKTIRENGLYDTIIAKYGITVDSQ